VALLEVDRETNFAPVKNAEGSPEDSPGTARETILQLAAARWTAAGGTLPAVPLEVSANLSLVGEGLEWARDAEIELTPASQGSGFSTVSAASGGSFGLFGTMAFFCDLLSESAAAKLGVCGGQERSRRGGKTVVGRLVHSPSVGGGALRYMSEELLKVVTLGNHTPTASGPSFRVHHTFNGKRISVWHELPLLVGVDDVDGSPIFNFVCEIPQGSARKFEIHKSLAHNPIVQDVTCKGGTCTAREYQYPPESPGCPANYGALPQTWEDPAVLDSVTGAGGDNDPIDVLHVAAPPCSFVGQVRPVRVLGALAMLDNSNGTAETDWKLIVVDAGSTIRSLNQLPSAVVPTLREWLKLYKTAEGKPENTFALEGEVVPAATAVAITMGTHQSWRSLKGCSFRVPSPGGTKTAPCWRKLKV
jgi:inorganic pyrophosphatase